MARPITSPELALLRSDTQWSKLYLAIYQPNTVYSARLNGVPSSNDRVYQITYDGGSGTLADVKVGMTLYVGSVAGAYDLGMCVIRKTPGAATFYIGLTSEIAWADNCYLTVVDDFDLWAKHATIASTVLSMNVDVGYSDQHADFAPVPVLGTHAVAWLDAATVDVDFDASDSWVLGSSISAYAWTAPGSDSIVNDTTSAPTITYDVAGCYAVYCTVTAANGKSTTGVRHVFIYDRDVNQPATVFQLSQCIGDHDTGGWMFDMTMEAEASLTEIHDRALVVLFAEDWYGSTNQEIGPVANRENIVCVGRIVGESLRWDRETGQVHFTVQGLQHWLSKIKAFPVEMTFAGAAGAWNEMPALTVDRVLWHILYWHSTAIETMDFYPTNDTRYATDGKTIASNIWGQLNDIAFSKLFAVPGVDRFGRLFIEIDQQMIPEADRDAPVVMTLTDADWAEAIDFSRVIVQECSLISLNAEEVNSSGLAVTRYALSPGHVPLRYGEPEMLERALCTSQSNANELAGLLLGWRTNQYPDVPLTFAQNNRMIDCFPRQVCGFSVATGDTPREVAYAGQLIPRRVAFYFEGDTGYFYSEINFEAETFAQIASNGDIPDTNEIDMETPPMDSLPSLPDLPVLLPGTLEMPSADAPTLGPRKLLIHDTGATSKGLLYSVTAPGDTARKWLMVNAGLTTAQYQNINRIVVCPNGAVYVACLGWGVNAFIARAPYVGGTFVIIEDNDTLFDHYVIEFPTLNHAQVGVHDLACNNTVSEKLIYMKGVYPLADTMYGDKAGFSVMGRLTNYEGGGSISYGAGKWLHLYGAWSSGPVTAKRTISADGSVSTPLAGFYHYRWNKHQRIGISGTTLQYVDEAGSTLKIGTDNLTSEVNVGSSFVGEGESLGVSYNGLYLLGSYYPTFKGKSSDGGSSWADISSLPYVGNIWQFAYSGGVGTASRWVAGSSYLYYSENFGTSWIDIQGNLPLLSSLYQVDIIKVLAY